MLAMPLARVWPPAVRWQTFNGTPPRATMPPYVRAAQ